MFACFLTFKAEIIPDTLFDDNSYVRMLHAVEDIGEWWEWLAVSISALFGLYWWIRQKEDDIHNIYAVTFMTFGLYLSFDGAYAPAILNSQSVRNASIEINRAVPASEGILYEYIEGGNKTKGDPIHFFEVNFYLHNRVENFEKRKPDKGFLLITKGDATLRFPQFEREGYRFKLRYEANRREMQVYEFTKAD